MTVFYDPAVKKPQPWIPAVFLILPILIVCIALIYGQQQFQEKVDEEKRQGTTDVFEKFPID